MKKILSTAFFKQKKMFKLSKLIRYIPPTHIDFYREIACNAVEDPNLEQNEVENFYARSNEEE